MSKPNQVKYAMSLTFVFFIGIIPLGHDLLTTQSQVRLAFLMLVAMMYVIAFFGIVGYGAALEKGRTDLYQTAYEAGRKRARKEIQEIREEINK